MPLKIQYSDRKKCKGKQVDSLCNWVYVPRPVYLPCQYLLVDAEWLVIKEWWKPTTKVTFNLISLSPYDIESF